MQPVWFLLVSYQEFWWSLLLFVYIVSNSWTDVKEWDFHLWSDMLPDLEITNQEGTALSYIILLLYKLYQTAVGMSRTTSPTGCSLSLAAYPGQSPAVFSVKHLHEDCVCKNWWRSSRLSQTCSVLWCECFQSRFGRGVLHNCGPGRGSFTEVLVDTEE